MSLRQIIPPSSFFHAEGLRFYKACTRFESEHAEPVWSRQMPLAEGLSTKATVLLTPRLSLRVQMPSGLLAASVPGEIETLDPLARLNVEPQAAALLLRQAVALYTRLKKSSDAYPPPIWSRRLKAYHSGYPRSLRVELTPDLVLRVVDPKSGIVRAQSRPGVLADLHHEVDARTSESSTSNFSTRNPMNTHASSIEAVQSQHGALPSDEREEGSGAVLDRRQQELNTLCERWVGWCRTHRLYGQPLRGAGCRLGGSTRPVPPSIGATISSAELCAFHIAYTCQPHAIDKRVFDLHYVHRTNPSHAAATHLGISEQHFHRLLADFRTRVHVASMSILEENEAHSLRASA